MYIIEEVLLKLSPQEMHTTVKQVTKHNFVAARIPTNPEPKVDNWQSLQSEYWFSIRFLP